MQQTTTYKLDCGWLLNKMQFLTLKNESEKLNKNEKSVNEL